MYFLYLHLDITLPKFWQIQKMGKLQYGYRRKYGILLLFSRERCSLR